MATWVLAGGIATVVLLLAGAVLVILLATRGDSDDAARPWRLRWFRAPDPGGGPPPPERG